MVGKEHVEVLKLSLTRPALEHLLGGDTELEIDLREQVARSFAGKHLAKLIDDEIRRLLALKANSIATQAVSDQIGEMKVQGYRNAHAALRPAFKDAIVDAVCAAADEYYSIEKIRKFVDEQCDRLKARIECTIERTVNRAITEKKIEEMVEARVLQRLTMAASLGAQDGKPLRVVDLKDPEAT